MTLVKQIEGKNEVYNDAGVTILGSDALKERGLTPKVLLETSLGLCVSISLQKIMDYDKVEYNPSSVQIEVAAQKAADGTNWFERFHVRVKLPPTLEPAYKQKLMSVVERACTIGNTLRSEAVVETVEW